MTASALYEGFVYHRRVSPPSREFRHHIALAYLDLDELPNLLEGRLVSRRPGIVRVCRRDLLSDPSKCRRRPNNHPPGPVEISPT